MNLREFEGILKKKYILLLSLVLFTICGHISDGANAGELTINVKMTLSVVSDRIEVRITATNIGNEATHQMESTLSIFDQSLKSPILRRLDVQQNHSFFFEVVRPVNKRGVFPFVGEVRFHDAKLYPYSALAAGTFKLDSKFFAGLTAEVGDLTIKKKETLAIHVINHSKDPKNVNALLYLPQALMTPEKNKRLRLGSNGKSVLEFPVQNRFGKGGATYPVFCILEYNDQGHHQAVILRPKIRLDEPKNWFIVTRWYWLSGLVPIGFFWVMIALKRFFK